MVVNQSPYAGSVERLTRQAGSQPVLQDTRSGRLVQRLGALTLHTCILAILVAAHLYFSQF